MLVITDDSTRTDLAEALTHLAHRAGRVTCVDPAHAAIHADIDELLNAWQAAEELD